MANYTVSGDIYTARGNGGRKFHANYSIVSPQKLSKLEFQEAVSHDFFGGMDISVRNVRTRDYPCAGARAPIHPAYRAYDPLQDRWLEYDDPEPLIEYIDDEDDLATIDAGQSLLNEIERGGDWNTTSLQTATDELQRIIERAEQIRAEREAWERDQRSAIEAEF